MYCVCGAVSCKKRGFLIDNRKNQARGLTGGSPSAIILGYKKEARLLFSPAGSARVRSIPEYRAK